jgi:membrane protein DedA with SNARE-associated domain
VPYLVVFAIVFGVNLLPAFGPPTWAILVFTRIHWHLNPVGLVVIGAVAAASGRYILALGARRFSGRLPSRMRSNLEDARAVLEQKRAGTLAIFALFVVSPLPSAQLFVAAGFLNLELRLFTLAFFIGRLISYSLYVSLAVVADRQFGNVISNLFGSAWSIILQIVLLAAVCVLPLVNWQRLLRRHPPPEQRSA